MPDLYDAWRWLRDKVCFWRGWNATLRAADAAIERLQAELAGTYSTIDRLVGERNVLQDRLSDTWVPEPNADDAPLDKIELGNNAQRLLSDPVLQLAFNLAEADLRTVWEQSSGQDSEGREAAYWGLRGLYAGKQKLRAILAAKKVIEAEAERKRKADEYKAERGIRELRVV